MRTLLLSLLVLALGLGAVGLAVSPGASAQSLTTTVTGSVGSSANHDAFAISLSASTLAAGTYQFKITDYSIMHNFDLCKGTSCTGSNTLHKTTVPGTGTVLWTVNLTPGTYTYQCDMHPSFMKKHFTVTGTTVTITSVVATRTLVTVSVKSSKLAQLGAVLLKGTTRLASAGSSTAATSATFKLKPSAALAPGTYVVQARATTGTTSVFARKQIQVS